MSSQAKISANRENALKSTGPRSERGRSKSRLNALKLGIHATIPVLPGEDAGAYREIVKANINHFAPIGPVENMLVRQITTEQWRLERIHKAENVLSERLIAGKIVALLGSLNETEAAYINSSYADELREEIRQSHRAQIAAVDLHNLKYPCAARSMPPKLSDEEMNDGAETSLGQILEPKNIMLECLVPNTERAPQTYLVNERRVTVRAYLAYVSKLKELQEARLMVTFSSGTNPAAAENQHTDAEHSVESLL